NVAAFPTATTLHTYTSPGTYPITLTYTILGCTYTKHDTFYINAKPTAGFSAAPTTICPGQAVSFTNSSTGATGYTWLFGDGTTSGATNSSHIYSTPGNYTVRLVASNNGCT